MPSPQRQANNSDSIVTPSDHYQHEKHKRAGRVAPVDDLMDAAKREYRALLDAQAAKGKGGRPKKKPDAEDVSHDE